MNCQNKRYQKNVCNNMKNIILSPQIGRINKKLKYKVMVGNIKTQNHYSVKFVLQGNIDK